MAFEREGHEVIPFTPVKGAPEGWITAPPEVDMVELVKSLDVLPDLFIMVESRVGAPFLPRRIADLKIPTACWFFDNHLNYRWNKEAAALFDYAFFAQLNQLRQAWRYGRKNVRWLPFAADEVFHRDFGVGRDIDIGYVGSIIPEKKPYFDVFERHGLEVVTNSEYLRYEDIGRFYSRCKLVFNISARRDLNPRAFEASMAGALVVNQSLIDEGAREIFTEGQNTVFHNFDDAPMICARLLENDAEREKMAGNAKELVLSAHTYRNRVREIAKIVSEGVTRERMRLRSTFVVPMAEGLVCRHPHFKWRERGGERIKEAFGRSPAGSLFYLLKYAWSRLLEKVEKVKLSLGKAPV